MNLIIADDHDIVRLGLRNIFAQKPEIKIVGEANSGRELIAKIQAQKNNVDVIILDISMPDMDGIEVLKFLKEAKISVKVLVMSFFTDKKIIDNIFSLGASGFIHKGNVYEEIGEALEKIMFGIKYLHSSFNEKGMSYLNEETQGLDVFSKLSDRELQIFKELVKGSSIKEISKKYELKSSTISTFKKRIFDKLAVSSLSELAVYAYKNNIKIQD